MSTSTDPEPTIRDVMDRLDEHDRRFDAIDRNMARLAELCTKQFENLHERLDALERGKLLTR